MDYELITSLGHELSDFAIRGQTIWIYLYALVACNVIRLHLRVNQQIALNLDSWSSGASRGDEVYNQLKCGTPVTVTLQW